MRGPVTEPVGGLAPLGHGTFVINVELLPDELLDLLDVLEVIGDDANPRQIRHFRHRIGIFVALSLQLALKLSTVFVRSRSG